MVWIFSPVAYGQAQGLESVFRGSGPPEQANSNVVSKEVTCSPPSQEETASGEIDTSCEDRKKDEIPPTIIFTCNNSGGDNKENAVSISVQKISSYTDATGKKQNIGKGIAIVQQSSGTTLVTYGQFQELASLTSNRKELINDRQRQYDVAVKELYAYQESSDGNRSQVPVGQGLQALKRFTIQIFEDKQKAIIPEFVKYPVDGKEAYLVCDGGTIDVAALKDPNFRGEL